MAGLGALTRARDEQLRFSCDAAVRAAIDGGFAAGLLAFTPGSRAEDADMGDSIRHRQACDPRSEDDRSPVREKKIDVE
jgi:hypothetical protein